MDALEVGILGGIAGLDQRFKASLHQGGYTAAQNGLLAEQVGLGFDLKGGLHNGRTGTADAGAIGQRHIQAVAGVVLLNGYQAGYTLALDIFAADGMARALGGDHEYVHVLRRLDLAEMNVKAMGKRDGLALSQVGLDVLLVHIRLALVGDQDHNDVGGLGGIGHIHHGQAVLSGLLSALAALIQANDDVDAAVMQVQRMGMALAAVADNGNGLSLEHIDVAIRFVVDFQV